MKKLKIIAFLIFSLAMTVVTNSCNNSHCNISLQSKNDSLNYAVGIKEMTIVRDALLKKNDTITAEDKSNVIKGFNFLYNNKDLDKDQIRAIYNGLMMGDNFNYILKDGFLFGDSNIVNNIDIICQGITDAIYLRDWVKDSRSAQKWIQNKVHTPLTKEEVDTANYIMGFLNGHQIRNMVLKTDTSKEFKEIFCENLFEAMDGSKSAYLEGIKGYNNFKKRFADNTIIFNDSDFVKSEDILLAGFFCYFEDKTPLIEEKEALDMLTNYFQSRSSKIKEEINESKKEHDNFFEENIKKENVFETTDKNVQYEIHKKGEGEIATVNDTILAHSIISIRGGKEIDNSYKKGKPIKLSLYNMTPAWKEIFTQMPAGSKFTIYNRHDKKTDPSDPIPPLSIMTFEIEILQIIKGK